MRGLDQVRPGCWAKQFGKGDQPGCKECDFSLSCRAGFHSLGGTSFPKALRNHIFASFEYTNRPSQGFECWGGYELGDPECEGCPNVLGCASKMIMDQADKVCFGAHFNSVDPACVNCQGAPRCEQEFCRRSRIAAGGTVTGRYSSKEPGKMTIAKAKTIPPKRYVYCEKAPPREVLEAAGLVWSFGLKAQYERHLEWIKYWTIHDPNATNIRLIPESELRRAIPVPWGAPLAEFRKMDSQKGFSLYARCKLCGGWMRETIITQYNDKRLRPQVELFSTKQERTLLDTPQYQWVGIDFGNGVPESLNKALESFRNQIESWKIPQEKALLPKDFCGKTLDDLKMEDMDKQTVEGFGDCKSCVRGPYTFTIEYRPGYGIFMRATSSCPTGTVLVAEKSISEADLQIVSVKMVWDKFVTDISRDPGETLPKIAIETEAFKKKVYTGLGLSGTSRPDRFEDLGPVCPIRSPASCRTARQHISRFVCDTRCPLKLKP